jgi:hypothetical protein
MNIVLIRSPLLFYYRVAGVIPTLGAQVLLLTAPPYADVKQPHAVMLLRVRFAVAATNAR